MKLCTFVVDESGNSELRIGVVRDDGSVVDLSHRLEGRSMVECIEDQEGFLQIARDVDAVGGRSGGSVYPASKIRLKAPLLRPGKIVAVLVNSQGMLGGADIQLDHPRLFMKAPSTVVGPEETIRAPSYGVRPEVELGIVVGWRISHVTPMTAEDTIFGYTIFNDVTAPRDSKEDAYLAYRRDAATGKMSKTMLRGPLFRSKNHDTFGPMGPWIVTSEELREVSGLKMETRFNGVVLQKGSTAEYLFTPGEILSFVSGFLTLEPGDLVACGTIGWTQAGKGGLDPSEWILPSTKGTLELEIEKIGVLRNEVRPGG